MKPDNLNKVIEAIDATGLRAVVAWCLTDDSIGDKVQRTREYAKKYNVPDSRITIFTSP